MQSIHSSKVFHTFSPKQVIALSWWRSESSLGGHSAIICDGAVRSGKTLCMSLSFVAWAQACFSGQNFALCGKTVSSLRRNVITPLRILLGELGFTCVEKLSKNWLEVTLGNTTNRYYLFGGKDESSAALIQGMTLAGILFDEVALMPRSFVEQALARCSVEGSKFWFNCNPENPHHWFYNEWIEKKDEKNVLYLHFAMEDNPSLSPAMINRYRSLYTGAFYDRFVLGKWVSPQGLVYPMFDPEIHVRQQPDECERYIISCDYGITNPASFGLWGLHGSRWYRLREYYYNSRETGFHKTDEDYYHALEGLAGGYPVERVIVDPSASSFIQCIRQHGRFQAAAADNRVLEGIRCVSDALSGQRIAIADCCKDCLREFTLYRWDTKSDRDQPVKENDHAMDDLRYFVMSMLSDESGEFFAKAVDRY